MNADGHYGAHLAAEVLALRDSVQGWQSAGRPGGRPIDIDADRRLADAVTHLTAAAAALDALTTIDNRPLAAPTSRLTHRGDVSAPKQDPRRPTANAWFAMRGGSPRPYGLVTAASWSTTPSEPSEMPSNSVA